MKKTENATNAKTSTGSHGRLRVIAAPAVGVRLPMAERGSRVRSAVLGGGKRRGMLVMWWKNSKDHGRAAHGSYALSPLLVEPQHIKMKPKVGRASLLLLVLGQSALAERGDGWNRAYATKRRTGSRQLSSTEQ